LKNRIHFIGRQSDETLRDLYCGATALVFPSLYEGFGLPILEAMSCGTPVITSRISSMPEVGGDAAIYIDPHESDSLVSALEEFENKRHDHQALRDASLRQADKFSWERCARETLATYARCLAE
jgi:glycosyltransferase involved in cell wall biosynthesis